MGSVSLGCLVCSASVQLGQQALLVEFDQFVPLFQYVQLVLVLKVALYA